MSVTTEELENAEVLEELKQQRNASLTSLRDETKNEKSGIRVHPRAFPFQAMTLCVIASTYIS